MVHPRIRHVLLGLYVVLCLGSQTWPGYAWFGARIEPRILGAPFSLVWVIGWVLATFLVLVVYDLTRPDRERN